VILPQLNLTKLKLEHLKYGFNCKNKERYCKNTDEKFKFKMAQNSKNLRLNGHTSFEFQT